MKHLIQCIGCSMCAIGYETGFTGRRFMVCTDRDGEEVVDGDGCTMGDEGVPQTAVIGPCDVTINDHEAVYGIEDE